MEGGVLDCSEEGGQIGGTSKVPSLVPIWGKGLKSPTSGRYRLTSIVLEKMVIDTRTQVHYPIIVF